MKRTNTSLWFSLIGFLSITACADAPQTASPQILEQQNDLSWPKAQLLDPSLKWERSIGSFPHSLGFLHPRHTAQLGTAFYPTVDLSGEWFVVVISTGASLIDSKTDYDAILKGAGYKKRLPIPNNPDLGYLSKAGEERTANDVIPVTALRNNGYIKRAGMNIRLVAILEEDSYEGNFSKISGKRVSVFASEIMPLQTILKNLQ